MNVFGFGVVSKVKQEIALARQAFMNAPMFLVMMLLALPQSVYADGLGGVVRGAIDFFDVVIDAIIVLAILIGIWFVAAGILKWKKSSDEHGGQVEFKSVVVPIVAGVFLIALSTFILLTTDTLNITGTDLGRRGL